MKKKLVLIILVMISCICVNFFKLRNDNSFYEIDENLTAYNYNDFKSFVFKNDVKYTQTILSKKDNLNAIRIYVDPVEKKYDSAEQLPLYLRVTLKDDKNNVIEKYNFGKFLSNNKEAYFDFKFKNIIDSKNKVFKLEYEAINVPNFSKLSFSKVKSLDDISSLKENEKSNEKYTLVYSTFYKNDNKVIRYFIIVSLLSFIFLGISFVLLKNDKMKIENRYLIIAMTIGILIGLFSLSFAGNDEISHFARIYDISEGNIVTKSINKWPQSKIPGRAIIKITRYDNIKDIININDNIKILFDMQFSSVYSYLSYIPQVFAMQLCKAFISHAFYWPYIIRFIQLLMCVFMIYYAIKIVPFGKKNIFMIGFIPTIIKQISLISADSLLISSSILYICLILKINDKKIIEKSDLFLLIILATIISISKLVYMPIIFLFCLLLNNIGKKEKIKKMLLISFVAIGITVIWNCLAMKNLTGGQGVNTLYIIKYFIKHPIELLWINLNTISTKGIKYLIELFGGTNNPEKIIINGLFSIIYIIIYLYVSFNGDLELKKSQKRKIMIVTVCTVILINLSLLVTCTPIYSNYIVGIQGRYFTPLLIPISLLISNKKSNKNYILSQIDILILLLYYPYILKIIYAFF